MTIKLEYMKFMFVATQKCRLGALRYAYRITGKTSFKSQYQNRPHYLAMARFHVTLRLEQNFGKLIVDSFYHKENLSNFNKTVSCFRTHCRANNI